VQLSALMFLICVLLAHINCLLGFVSNPKGEEK